MLCLHRNFMLENDMLRPTATTDTDIPQNKDSWWINSQEHADRNAAYQSYQWHCDHPCFGIRSLGRSAHRQDSQRLSKSDNSIQIRTKREYAALRGALLSGGVDANTLDILISTDRPPTPASEPSDSTDNLCKPWSPTAQPFVPQSAHTNGFQYRENISRSPSNQYSDSSHPSTPPTPFPDKNDAPDGTHVPVLQQTEQPRYQTNYDDRSLVFRGLSPTTTLLDITNVIRGGSVLNAYLRPKERMAHVSFVESSAAQAFRKYAKRNDIYVKGKRVCLDKLEKIPQFADNLSDYRGMG